MLSILAAELFMKKVLIVLIALILSITLFSCTTIQQTIHLQDVEVNGPINPPPIKITKDKISGAITISPRLAVNNKNEILANIGNRISGNAVQDSLFKDKKNNLLWHLPELSFGFDIDFAISNHVSINGGLNFTSINQNKLLGGSLGLGFFKENNGSAVRFDAGILMQEIHYDAKTIVETTVTPAFGNSSSSIYYYHDINKNSDIDLYAMFTYNSILRDFPVNFFINVSYFSQTILSFEPRQTTDIRYLYFLSEKTTKDARGEASSSFLSFTPGVYLDFNESSRLVLGSRFMHDVGLDNPSRNFFFQPVIQLDVQF